MSPERIAQAQGFIAEYLLDEDMRAQCRAWETGTGDEDVELCLDEGAQLVRDLLDEIERLSPFAVIIRRFIERETDVYFGLYTDGLTIDGTVDIIPDEYAAILTLNGGAA